jgi:hypothetical protein
MKKEALDVQLRNLDFRLDNVLLIVASLHDCGVIKRLRDVLIC